MKAIILTGVGGIDKLAFVNNVKIPLIKKDQALIKVNYCGVNHLDTLIRQGKRPGPKKFPHILGSEIVGEVVKLNNSSTDIKVGDRVVVYPWTFCGTCKQCLSGKENICDNGGTIGRTEWGGYSEYAVVPQHNLIKISNKVDKENLCAITLAGTTAHHLIKRAGVKNNSIVLITGATGGVGTLLIQLLKNINCKIICVTSHPSKKDSLKKLGVSYIFTNDNFVKEVKEFFPQGLDFAIDIVGGRIWSRAVEILGKNGSMAFCATSLDEMGQINIGSAFSRQINILGSYGGTIFDTKAIIKLMEEGKIKPLINKVYSLNQASEAHNYIDQQKAVGKILIKI